MADFGTFLINSIKANLEPNEIQILKSSSLTRIIKETIANHQNQISLVDDYDDNDAPVSSTPVTHQIQQQPQSSAGMYTFKTIQEEEEEYLDTLSRNLKDLKDSDDENTYLIAKANNNIIEKSNNLQRTPPRQQQIMVNPMYDCLTTTTTNTASNQRNQVVVESYTTRANPMRLNRSSEQQQQPDIDDMTDFKNPNIYEDYIDHLRMNQMRSAQSNQQKKLLVAAERKSKPFFSKMFQNFKKHLFNGSSGSSNTSCSSASSSQEFTNYSKFREKATCSRNVRRNKNYSKKKPAIYSNTGLSTSPAVLINRRGTISVNNKLKTRARPCTAGQNSSKFSQFQAQMIKNFKRNKVVDKEKQFMMTNWDKILKKANKNPESFKRILQTKVNKPVMPVLPSSTGLELASNNKSKQFEGKYKMLNQKFQNKTPTNGGNGPSGVGPSTKQQMGNSQTAAAGKKAIIAIPKSSTPAQLNKPVVKKDLDENFRNSLASILGASGTGSELFGKKMAKNAAAAIHCINNSSSQITRNKPITSQLAQRSDQSLEQQSFVKQKKLTKLLRNMPLQSISTKLESISITNNSPKAGIAGSAEPASFTSWSTGSTLLKEDPNESSIKSTRVMAMPSASNQNISSVPLNTGSSFKAPARQPSLTGPPVKKAAEVRKEEKIDFQQQTLLSSSQIDHMTASRPTKTEKKDRSTSPNSPMMPVIERVLSPILTSEMGENNMQMFYFRPETPTKNAGKQSSHGATAVRTQNLIKSFYDEFNKTMSKSLAAALKTNINETDSGKKTSKEDAKRPVVDTQSIDSSQLIRMQQNIFKTLLKSKQFHNLMPTYYFWNSNEEVPNEIASFSTSSSQEVNHQDVFSNPPATHTHINSSPSSSSPTQSENGSRCSSSAGVDTHDERNNELTTNANSWEENETRTDSNHYSNNLADENRGVEKEKDFEYVVTEQLSQIHDDEVRKYTHVGDELLASRTTRRIMSRDMHGNYYNNNLNMTVRSSKQLLKELSIGRMVGRNLHLSQQRENDSQLNGKLDF